MFGKNVLFWNVATACILNAGNALCADQFMIGGYWENWSPAISPAQGANNSSPKYYENDFVSFNIIYYSFLTLAHAPDPVTPPDRQWDGKHIYESMARGNVIDVLIPAGWENPNNWQRVKIQAMIDECHAKGKQFIWAIGGWSDLTRTISDEQVLAFVKQCVELLKIAGDGIDFDWEHLSDNPAISGQQRKVLGKVFPALRRALDENGLSDKMIGYTTRFNAFWNNDASPDGVDAFDSSGEGIDIAEALAEADASFGASVDWVNIMLYDVPPSALGEPGGLTLKSYKMVLDHFEKYVPKDKIVMGFEPGDQVAGGVWEGMEVDKAVISHLIENGYGGVMFWAANHKGETGKNSQELAKYAKMELAISLKQ